MAAVHRKPRINAGFSSRLEQAKQVGKRVSSNMNYFESNVSIEEWDANRLLMAAVHRKPRINAGFSSRLEQTKQVGKKVSSSMNYFESNVSIEEWDANRKKIEEAVSFYRKLIKDQNLLASFSQTHGKKFSGVGIHVKAAKVVQNLGKRVNTIKQIGHVPGVEVGDGFHWRAELNIVGLHFEFQKGIDSLKSITGKSLAISIVDSGRYHNVMGNTYETWTYIGQGQNPKIFRGKEPKDQSLRGENLALKNSMEEKTPIRLIHCLKTSEKSIMAASAKVNHSGYKFVYVGLYRVTGYHKEKGEFGKDVYKFSLKRIEGQPKLDWEK
ncbi:SRA-YDG domain-containing protein [Corchorus olitorius]|uniref:SRA-YDG domain-containing protein n=1 Tax=Corchorus olitorius TaxID=93759 RepID=A0A1R3HB95_9ROSI|nr:SRA-YDG domain-containing protein [Corchorus olitorius]